MLRVYTCIVQEHDLRLVVLAAIVCALASFTAINLAHHVRRSTAPDAAALAGRRGDGERVRHLVDPLHRHAGVRAQHSKRLQCHAHLAVADRRHRVDRHRSGRRPFERPARRALARRSRGRRRHRRHALYRHGGFRNPGAHRLGSRPGHSVDRGRRAARLSRDQGRPDRGRPQMEGFRCGAAYRGDLQPPFHRDGRRLDNTRSEDRGACNRHPDRLAGRRGRARQPGYLTACLLWPGPRHSRPPSA